MNGSSRGSGIDRRGLLMAAGILPFAASAASAAAPVAKGTQLYANPDQLPEAENTRMRWAVVGLGGYATHQVLPGFVMSNKSVMTAFVSGNPDKAKLLGDRYGVTKFYNYDNFDDIKNDPNIDAVYIVLPVGLHAEYTIRALNAGKHVLVEKPMASTSKECADMIAAAKANNKQLGVAYRVHSEPNNIEVVRRIKAGDLGKLWYYTGDAGFDIGPNQWRLEKALAGGGSMYDIGIYALNAAFMTIGEDNPISVSAEYCYPKNDDRFKEVEGGINWRMSFASGVQAQGSSSYTYAGGTRFKIFGEKAAIGMDPASDYYDNHAWQQTSWGTQIPFRAGNPIDQFGAQVDNFSEAARTNTPHRTPGEMGLRDIRVIEAMYKSADAGGVPVKL